MTDLPDTLPDAMRALRTQFEAITEPHRPALWEYCRRLTGSAWDAEDLVQETLLKAFGALPRIWQPMNVRAYLFRIASNCWIDQVRHERRTTLDDLDEHEHLPATETAERGLEVSEAMERLVRLLPPRQRVVVLLCETLGFRASEVAAMLGTSEGAVKSLLHRARATLAADSRAESADAPMRDTEMLHPIVHRYVAAFNARDPDAIAALLDEEATTTIVGSADEFGRAVTRSASLAEWAAEPEEQWAEPGTLDGRPAIFILHRTEGGGRALGSMIRLEGDATAIHRQWTYYYTPELLRYAAARLGVPAHTHGYQYPAPA